MIWLWIVLAVAVTALLLRGKNIAPHNFIWALIPIDRYGVEVFGFILKPVYIYSILLVAFAVYSKKFRLKVPISVLITTMLFGIIIVMTMLFRGNSNIFNDVKIYATFFFTVICAASSLSLISGENDLRQIQDVIIATATGFGIVFISLFILNSVGINLPDVQALGLNDTSIFKIYLNSSDGVVYQSIRLRGFYMEPNASNIISIAGFSLLCGKFIQNGFKVKYIIYAVIITGSIVLTSSRSALVVLLLIFVVSVFRLFLTKHHTKRKLIFAGVLLSGLFVLSVIFVYEGKAFSFIYDNLLSSYENRSALTDEYGRFTIWKDALSKLFEGNWLTGLGIGAISTLIDAERDSHNTIIEVLCSSGIIAGVYYTLYFLHPLVYTVKRRIKDQKNGFTLASFIISYISVFLLLFTVSNITSVYLIYASFLLFIIPGVLDEEDQRKRMRYEI